jgi:hypothetical protein
VNWTPPHHPGGGALTRRVVVGVGLVTLVVLSPLLGGVASSVVLADGATTTTTPAPAPTSTATPGPTPVTTSVTDQTPVLPEPPAPDPSPHIRVLLARIGVLDAQAVLTAQQQQAASAHADQISADAALAQAAQAQLDADGQLQVARTQLGSSAAYAYMHAAGGDFVSVLQGDSTGGGNERELFAASVDHNRQLVVDAQAAVEVAGAAVSAAQGADDQAQQTASGQDGRVAAASGGLDDAHRELATAAADENLPVTARSWQLSLEGPSTFTADELAQWYAAQGHGSQATVPIADLTGFFIDQANAEGIRGDMAFAQSIHETGWFANNDTVTANNFAGIGHCSDCPGGFPFASAEVGVLAQIQLLKSYAQTNPTYNIPRADPNINGPAGCCQAWTQLGGVWASDTNYGPHILARYADMLEWLVLQRSAGA